MQTTLFKDLSITEYAPEDLRNNKLHIEDRAFHDWYRFVLSFPAHLVRHYFEEFSLTDEAVLLDPFCGTGTSLVEAKKNRIASYGIEASPMAAFASRVKVNWRVDGRELEREAEGVLFRAGKRHHSDLDTLLGFTPEQEKILLKDSISPQPLHKCLLLLNEIRTISQEEIRELFMLALAQAAVFTASNLKFGPEVGVSRKKKEDADVFGAYTEKIRSMLHDLASVEDFPPVLSQVIQGDARRFPRFIPEGSIDAVITSPPYPNEKDYTRTTRLESVLLGFIRSKSDLRSIKQGLLRSNTRNVYMGDHDDAGIEAGSKIDLISKEIERRRVALGKTSGFERLYPRVTRLYFGGMKRHLQELQPYLRSGARLAYVVGDQASYLQVMIRTGELLGEIAHEIGYKVIGLDLFRTRMSTATGEQLREEVLLLEWNQASKGIAVSKSKNRYDLLIEKVFFKNYRKGEAEVSFDREEFMALARELDIPLPKNLGDIIYSYRYRNVLPERILALLESGEEWVIRSAGRGAYKFSKSAIHRICPNPRLATIKVLDATPEIINRYALNDEQALLAILRYNRLIDTFLGVTCYSLQSHLRTAVEGMGQVETDEIYIGVGTKGTHWIIPVQAKGKKDQLGIVQIEQDFAICAAKFPAIPCRPVAAQFMDDHTIALFEFEQNKDGIFIREEKHYQIVPNENLSDSELERYEEE